MIEEKTIIKVLNEFEEELKESRRVLEMNTHAIELYSQTINHFETLLKEIKITFPQLDLAPFNQLVNTRFRDIEKAIADKPVNVINEKRILLYPPGEGRNFLKFIADRFMLYTLIIGGICLLSWIGFYYWNQNSENEKYKYSLFWIYSDANEKNKEIIQNVVNEFHNDSVFQARRKLFEK